MATKRTKPQAPGQAGTRPRGRAKTTAKQQTQWAPGVGLAIAGIVAVAAGTWWASACNHDAKPAAEKPAHSARVETLPPGVQPVLPSATALGDDDGGAPLGEAADAGAPDGPYEGPYVVARVLTAPVYSTMSRTSDKLIGYLRSGGKAPAEASPIAKPNCKAGWYHLLPRGYVCGKHVSPATPDAIAATETPPDFDAVVPYKYAYNTKDGTPLYREIPTREQMETYEPYLTSSAKARSERGGSDAAPDGSSAVRARHARDGGDAGAHGPVLRDSGDAEPRDHAADGGRPRTEVSGGGRDAVGVRPSDQLDAGVPVLLGDAGGDEPEPDLPWWQMAPDAGRRAVTLEDMAEGAGGVLVKRMARGFFVAVDRTFRKNDRFWIRTTEGLYAPSDRMSINSPPTFQGVDVGQNGMDLPVAFVMSEQANTYERGEGDELKKRKAKVKRFAAVALTGRKEEHGGKTYRETKEGYWVQDRNVTVVETASPPSGLGEREKWIDVNLTRQTLVAYEGTRAVYATLISSGKKGSTKATDHSTVQGEFRIRQKHVAATMDGDGAAPGEGPYSIQDVPYVMYFKGSYAIHGAFWHNNFGRKMSHGCVNLAPLDARRVFQWTEPQVPQGWHGALATDDLPGTRIVLHE